MPSSHDLDALLAILKQRLADGKLDEPAYRQCEQLLRERGSPMSDTGEAAPASPSDLKPGPVLLDRWLIVRLLGRGGFGEVFEAIDLDRRQSQAVKLLEPRMLAREEYLTRFRREFEIMRELEHPRVVRVYEYREEPEQQLALISMEHVAGGTVSDLVTLARHQEQPVPLPLALRIAGQTIEALVAAHRREVLHRDVTPRNILLAGGPAAELVADAQRDPQVKLVDFGIAGLVKPSTFSQTSRAMGTMGYVAPEMFSPAPRVTPAADLYGVAAVTYELVTGQLPVGRFESPSELRAGLPATVAETLDSLLLDLLRRNPDERPDAEAALARFQAVEKQWEVERARRRESETRQQAVEEAGPRTVPRSRRSKHVRPPRWLRYAFSGLALIGVIAVVFYIASGIASFKIPPREVSPPMESSDGASSESADGPSVESRTETPAATSPVATPPADDSEGSSEGPSSEPADALSVESPAETPAVTFPVATPAGGDSQKSTEGPSNEPADGPTVESLPETPPAMSPVATPPGDDSLESSEGPSNEPADALRVESPAETPPATSPVATPPADDSQKSTEGPSNEPADGPTVESPPETPPAMSPVATPPGDDSQGSSENPSSEPADALPVESPAEPAAPSGDDSQVDCQREEQVGEYGMVMVRICPGTFIMGSAEDDPQADGDEKPAHQVTLSEFWIGKYEVTNKQYRKFRPAHRPDFKGAKLPANSVSWREAKDFCLSAGYQLPSEAQWEYAARAGTQTPWSFGANEEDIGRFAWYDGNSGIEAHPVGKLDPNPWGLYDMHGNAWEWVADWYARYSEDAQIDPEGPSTGALRVLRGGSYWVGPRWLRSANRNGNRPEDRGWVIGFRCVRRPRRQP